MLLNLTIIILFCIVLIKAADILAVNLKIVTEKSKIGGFMLTSLVVGLATSFPELFVGITSALDGAPNLSLGNAIGSNIANMTLVAGGAAVLGGSIKLKNHSFAKDLLHSFLAAMAPLFLMLDNVLSRVDALILISLYIFYHYDILFKRNVKNAKRHPGFLQKLLSRLKTTNTKRNWMNIFFSLALMLFSADMIVRQAQQLAAGLNISVLLVGLFIVAVGTSLPELAVEYKAIRKKDTNLFTGNLLGSLVANGTLIIGITALISPIKVVAFNDYLIATLFLIIIFLFFYFYIRTKERLDRWEGFLLLLIYAVFIGLEFLT